MRSNTGIILFDEWINGVSDGTILSCEFMKLAVDRHLNDLVKSSSRDYPYYFSTETAQHAMTVIGQFRHTAGRYANDFFRISRMQAFSLCSLMGWLRKSDNRRRFTKAYEEVPRKWGKSEFKAAMGNYFLIFDGEVGSQVVIAATKIPQCRYVFNPMKAMFRKLINDIPEFAEMVKIKEHEILSLPMDAKAFCLSADAAKEDGANPHLGIIDELHGHVNGDLLKVVETGTLARDQALISIITTAGKNRFGICYEQRDTMIKILRGTAVNDRQFGYICTLDEDDDWDNPDVWIKANPHIGVTISMDNMLDAFNKAKVEGPSSISEFRIKNLNQWIDSPDVWIGAKEWRACADSSLTLDQFKGKKMVIGLDLASVEDIAAISILILPQEGVPQPVYFWKFYCPSAKISKNKRSDGVNYKQWVKDGHITMTPGNVIDYGYIYQDILKLCEDHECEVLEFDPYKSQELIPKLIDDGIVCNPHRQGFLSMDGPVNAVYRLVMNHPNNRKAHNSQPYLIHEDTPVMDWMMSNVELMYDPAGNVKISKNSVKGGGKKKSFNKVDGPVAMAMATTGYMLPIDGNESTYDDNDLIILS